MGYILFKSCFMGSCRFCKYYLHITIYDSVDLNVTQDGQNNEIEGLNGSGYMP